MRTIFACAVLLTIACSASGFEELHLERLLEDDPCRECDFYGRDLAGRDFNRLEIISFNFAGAKLESTDLTDSGSKSSEFSKTDFRSTALKNLLADVTEPHTTFTGADLSGARF